MGNYVGDESERSAAIAEDVAEMMGQGVNVPPAEDEVEAPDTGADPPGVETDTTAEPPPPLRIGEQEYDAAMAEDINQLVQWASSLTPEQYEKLNNALYGPEPEPTPEPAPEPEAPVVDYSELDPDVATAIKRQEEEIAALKAKLEEEANQIRSVQESTSHAQLEQQRVEFNAAEEVVRTEYMEKYGLTDADYQSLVSTAAQLGITYPNIERLGVEQGIRATLDTAMAANEDMRTKAIQAEAARIAQEQLNGERKEAAAALNPQGGTNIPDQNPNNLPISEKRAAMIEDLNQMLGNT